MLESRVLSVATSSEGEGTPAVAVEALVKRFPLARHLIGGGKRQFVHAVEGVTLNIRRHEVVALVGESGSGKTTLAQCIAGFLAPTQGRVAVQGRTVWNVTTKGAQRQMSRRELSRKVQMVFQDPSAALNPRQRVGSALIEPVLAHGLLPRTEARAWRDELLDRVGLHARVAHLYPHELDTGEGQRVVIARALTLRPEVLIADEPVSRLDVSMQGQVLNLLLRLREELGLTILFITHDLSVVRQVADRVTVMYLGKIVESGSADDFFKRTSHPYSLGLMRATPRTNGVIDASIIRGEIPSAVDLPTGCSFHARCPEATEACSRTEPSLKLVGDDHLCACLRRKTMYVTPVRPGAAVN